MPELPEVETVKESLKTRLLNRKIKDVNIYHDNIIAYPDVSSFQNQIKGQTILDILRRGKFLMFVLNDYYLLSHLRMEGKYFFKKKEEEKSKHEHVVFTLNTGEELRYHDTRKFGKMYLIPKEEITTIGPLTQLGVEPFSKELTSSYLKEKYKGKKLPIKSVLLDQSIITGIGNIYADEILYLSHLNPLTKASLLTEEDLNHIIEYTKETLTKAIKEGGTTIHTYTSVDGVSGKFQNSLYVHGREKEKCPCCGSVILKTKVGGRGTYFCPTCQK